MVVAGGHLDDDTVARWAYAIRLAVGAMPLAIYRRGAERPRARGTGTTVLPSGAGDAQRLLLDLLESDLVAATPSASIAAVAARAGSSAPPEAVTKRWSTGPPGTADPLSGW